MSQRSHSHEPNKILVPISTFIDKNRLYKALKVLAVLKDPQVVLFRVVEVPRRTTPLDPTLWKEDIEKAESFLKEPASWLTGEGYNVATRVVTARNTAGGIIDEANSGGYTVVLMMKRRIGGRWSKILHRSISEEVIRYANPLVLTFLAERS